MAFDLEKSLQAISDLFLDWFECRHPDAVSERILANSSNSEKLRQILRLLLVTYLITLVIQLPVLKGLDIDLTTLSFQLPAFLSFIFVAVSTAIALHASLKLFKIPSNLADTWAIYISHTVILAPIQMAIALPGIAALMRALSDAKHQNLDFVSVFVFVTKNLQVSSNTVVVAASNLLNFPVLTIGFCLFALVADKISRHYQVPREKAYSAMGFAIAIFIPLVLVGPSLLYYFDLYLSIGK